jgi:nitrogen fixation NifU-like protein
MEDLYREIILDHYENPRNYGVLPDADISYEDDNPLCGDRIRIDLKLQDGRIVDVRFSGKGCAISRASASMLTERIKGATVEEARQLTRNDILEMLGIPIGPARIKCALLSLKVLKAGLYGLPKIDWDELG